MTTPLTRLPDAPGGSTIAYRPYRGIEDIDGMGAANARLRSHVGVLDPIDIDAMRHRYAHLVHSNPLEDCLVVERGGTAVGYARVEWHDLVDGDRIYDHTVVVEPDAWGSGIAAALIDWSEGRSIDIAAANATARRTWLANYAFGGDAEVESALQACGYTAVRWDAEMLRPDLEDIPVVALADGYHLRPPSPEELPRVFDMAVAAFADHWGQYEASEQRIEEWVDDPRFRIDFAVVAWRGEEPAALVMNFLDTRPDGTRSGLLEDVCTHPDHRRLGLARACIAESLRRLREAGATSAYLGVDTDNQNRAYALYESCGFNVATSGTSYRKALPSIEDDR